MISLTRPAVSCVAIAVAFGVVASADAPHIYAIRGARLVTAVGAPIASGTIVIRNGLIDAVGAGVQPPADAMVIDGTSMTVYPGLIDMGNTAGLDVQVPLNQPDTLRTTEDAERWKRSVIFRPELEAADHMRPDAPELSRLVSTGVTTVLATPPGVIVKGQSALVNVASPADEPQIGSVADPRRGLQIVRTPVALHVQFADNVRGDGYPVSLLGAIAFVRQSFLDAQHQQLEEQRYDRLKTGVSRPVYDKSLDALQPALAGRLPVAFEAGLAREIRRALAMAQEFKLDPIITGGHESDQVATELKARNARVIYSLNFPARSRILPPDADEPVRELRLRAQAAKSPAALEKAGVPFAFASAGLREPRDFLRNAARAVKDGLPADAAIRALTIDAAKIAGASSRLGSLEKGKIANVIVTDGDLFEDKTRVKHAFVDGRPVTIDDQPQPERRGGRGGQ
ncbi:MAG TPA: amidohydrolase family protein [Vicinamibacterales bacterium]|jgi:imidazolonepropionase-like amidohydrolase|nr:amidohydrolase family protein [Vicinamibacterales bacterium]